MRVTGKEIIEFCDELLVNSGGTIGKLCRDLNIGKSVISMWRSHPDVIPRVDTVVKLANYFNMGISEFLGQEKQELSSSVIEFSKLEKYLTETEVASVLAVARTFYNSHSGEKEEAI